MPITNDEKAGLITALNDVREEAGQAGTLDQHGQSGCAAQLGLTLGRDAAD